MLVNIYAAEGGYPTYGYFEDTTDMGKTREVDAKTLRRWRTALKRYDEVQREMAELFNSAGVTCIQGDCSKQRGGVCTSQPCKHRLLPAEKGSE